MNCLRCGYCCCNMFVVVVDDPNKGESPSNLIVHQGEGKPCKHTMKEADTKVVSCYWGEKE